MMMHRTSHRRVLPYENISLLKKSALLKQRDYEFSLKFRLFLHIWPQLFLSSLHKCFLYYAHQFQEPNWAILSYISLPCICFCLHQQSNHPFSPLHLSHSYSSPIGHSFKDVSSDNSAHQNSIRVSICFLSELPIVICIVIVIHCIVLAYVSSCPYSTLDHRLLKVTDYILFTKWSHLLLQDWHQLIINIY